jgi:hypothetical protein
LINVWYLIQPATVHRAKIRMIMILPSPSGRDHGLHIMIVGEKDTITGERIIIARDETIMIAGEDGS